MITSNIGLKYGVQKAEELLAQKEGEEPHTQEADMDFHTYFRVVQTNILDGEHKRALPSTTSPFHEAIKTCWKLCNFERTHKFPTFSTEHCIMLWRLYNFLSETDDDGEPLIPVQLDPEEAVLLFRAFMDVTGQRSKDHLLETFLTDAGEKPVTFCDVLNVFEKDLVPSLSSKNITVGLQAIYGTYIANVMMKGEIQHSCRPLYNTRKVSFLC